MRIKYRVIVSILMMVMTLQSQAALNYTDPVDTLKISGIESPVVQSEVQKIPLKTKEQMVIDGGMLQQDIQSLYQSGYFSKVYAHSIFKENQHILHITVEENPIIMSLQLGATQDEIQDILEQTYTPYLNKPLNTLLIEKNAEEVHQKLKSKGYEFFEISSITFEKSSQTLVFEVQEGVVEDIVFLGLTTIESRLLSREMYQKKGALLNSIFIRKDREAFIKLGYFSYVSTPQFKKGSSTNDIIIVFDLIEKKMNTISLGIEQDLDYVYGFVSHSRPHVLMHSDSLFLKTQVQFSNNNLLLDRYSISYSQPWLFNRYRVSGSVSAYSSESPEVLRGETTTSIRRGIVFSSTFPMTEYTKVVSSLKHERIEEGASSDAIEAYQLNSIELALDIDTIKHFSNPKKGKRFSFSVEKGNDIGFVNLGGLSFTKYTSSWSQFVSFFQNTVLGYRVQGGIFFPNKESKVTYEDEYFILGGASSLRGYNEQESPFSGLRNMLVNLEVRHMLTPSIQSVAFVDMGAAFDTKLDVSHVKTGYGVGFRYLTPIGPVRLDYAIGESSHYIHFGLGQVF